MPSTGIRYVSKTRSHRARSRNHHRKRATRGPRTIRVRKKHMARVTPMGGHGVGRQDERPSPAGCVLPGCPQPRPCQRVHGRGSRVMTGRNPVPVAAGSRLESAAPLTLVTPGLRGSPAVFHRHVPVDDVIQAGIDVEHRPGLMRPAHATASLNAESRPGKEPGRRCGDVRGPAGRPTGRARRPSSVRLGGDGKAAEEGQVTDVGRHQANAVGNVLLDPAGSHAL